MGNNERTNPSDNRWIALMLVNQNFELTLKLCLLVRIRRPTSVIGQARHVLDDHQTNFIASSVEQIWLNFDLWHTI